MPNVETAKLGRLVLRADAAYCAVAALCLLAFLRPLAEALAAPSEVLVGLVVGTGLWAIVLLVAARAVHVRPWLRRVLVANAVAAGAIAGLGVAHPYDVLSLLLLAVAAEVATFAVAQSVALSRPT